MSNKFYELHVNYRNLFVNERKIMHAKKSFFFLLRDVATPELGDRSDVVQLTLTLPYVLLWRTVMQRRENKGMTIFGEIHSLHIHIQFHNNV